MLRILSLVIAILLLISAVILILGYNASPQYSNTITFEVPYTVDLTWQELLKIQEAPKRKSDVTSVEILEEFGKLVAWQENLKNGGYRIYRMNKRGENKVLVLELTESSYGLKGIWTFGLEQNGNGTIVTVSEESELSDIKRRGYRALIGREVDLLAWQKYLKVGLIQTLLITP
jgi:hypothetical protein